MSATSSDNTATMDEPLPSLDNPPGRDALEYRALTHAGFTAAMVKALASNSKLRPLAHSDTDDPALALVDAWATTLDVLTFYQERIANEGYLRTATERRSLQELSRAVGYELNPGVAAETYLAFTLDDGPGAPEKVMIEAGTKVQSVPGPGEQAQIFETVEAIDARPEWNMLRPQMSQLYLPKPNDTETEIYLQGVNTGLRPGDGLLVVSKERADDPDSERWGFRRVQTVTADPAAGRSAVTFDESSDWRRFGKPILSAKEDLRVYAFRLRAALFGHNAPDWRTMPDTVRDVYLTSIDITDNTKKDAAKRCKDWPDFSITQVSTPALNTIHLDAAYPQIRPGEDSWLVLTAPVPDANDPLRVDVGLYQVGEVAEDARSNFTLSSKTTRVKLSGEHLEKFDDKLRETTVFAQSEKLDIAETPLPNVWPIDKNQYNESIDESAWTITLDRQIDGLRKGMTLLVTGITDDGAACELVTLQDEPRLQAERTIITFAPPLRNTYHRDSVVIYANVARATHGETREEVLGSGEAGRPFQTFALRQAPLTYIPAKTVSGGVSALTVRVNGIEWREKPTLYGLGPRDRAFTIHEGPDGQAVIQFGDGATGARPPSGIENITATYRVGLGSAGNLKADQLRVLLTRPLGVRGVTNPQPAAGGADRDDPDDARQRAPRTVLTLDRIVSLRDYEDFARAFGGVAKARADWLWDGSRGVVFITVVAPDGSSVDSETLGRLRAAIDEARDPAQHVRVDTQAAEKFSVRARLVVQPEYRAEPVRAAAEAALRQAFSLKRRDFGQDVTESEILNLLQSIEGVEAADLERQDQEKGWNNNRFAAHLAYYDTSGLHPATLLILDDGPNAVKLRPIPDLNQPEVEGATP